MSTFKIKPIENTFQLNDILFTETQNELKTRLYDINITLNNLLKKKFAENIVNAFDAFINEKHTIAQNNYIYNITNDWLICYEIIYKFNLILNTDLFIHFDNMSKGSYINAVHHYVKTMTKNKYKWFGLTSNSDTFSLIKNYPNNWLMDDNNTGDITNLSNIFDLKKKINRSVDLYTCDISNHNIRENESFTEGVSQILCGLLTLKSGGSMFVKHRTVFEPLTVSYISLLTLLFEDVFLYCPISSKRTDIEIYIVCKKYKHPFNSDSIETNIINKFISYYETKKPIPFISSDVINTQIECIRKSDEIYKSQIRVIENLMYSINNIMNPTINEFCYKTLLSENTEIIKKYKQIKIFPIHIFNHLCMIE